MKTFLLAALSLLLLTLPALAEPPGETTIEVPTWAPKPANPPVFAWPEMRIHASKYVEAKPSFRVDGGNGDPAAAIQELVGPAVQALGGSMEEVASALRVTGPPEARALARQQIEAVGRYLEGRSSICVQLISWPEPERPDSAEVVTRALREGRAHLEWTTTLSLRRGEGGLREALEERTFVYGLEPEVAQQAALVQPLAATLRTGRRLYVACRPTRAGEALATLSLGLSRETTPSLRTVTTAPGTLDLPEAAFLSLTTSLHVEKERPSMILLDHPFEDGGLVVIVTLVDPPAMEELPFELVDLTAITGHPDVLAAARRLDVGLRLWDLERADGYQNGDYDASTEALRSLRETALRDALEHVDDSVALIDLAPSVVAVIGSRDARARIREILADLATRTRLRREGFRTPWKALATAPYFDPIQGTIAPGALRAKPGPRPTGLLDLPVAAGTPCLLIHGTWQRVLARFGSEIAQGAVVVRPITGNHVGGEAVLLRPDPIRRWGAPRVNRSTSTLLERKERDLSVRLDVDGKRTSVPRHPLDMVRTAKTAAELVLQKSTTIDLFRSGDEAHIHVWSR